MQNLRFSDLEGVRIAIEMERRGGEFYRHAARISKNARAIELLTKLAEDEAVHGSEFEKLLSQLLQTRGEDQEQFYSEEASAYLSAVAADVVFSGGLMELARDRGFESPVAILKSAIQSEKDSVLFYSEMALLASGAQTRSVFEEIVRQEKHHLNKLQKCCRSSPLRSDGWWTISRSISAG